jgi:hypothetical protein
MGGKFYVAAGGPNVHDRRGLDVYDPVTNTWKAKATGAAGFGAAATVLANRLYAVGGFFADNALASMAAYDRATDTWAAKASMSSARAGLAAATAIYHGVSYLFAVGGLSSTGRVTGRLERYTP